VAGKWKSLHYRDRYGDWYDFILEIHEDQKDPTKLTGTIYVDTWYGPPNIAEPVTPCQQRIKGKMTAEGSFVGGEVVFGATSELDVTEVICGSAGGYAPDHFSGRLEVERQEFQSVNNDGAMSVNEPTVFRRIGCFDDAHQELRKDPARSDVAPPPFFPKHEHRSGC
jgi:hypothetical protein